MRLERRIRWVIATLLLCGLCYTAVFAHGYDQNAQNKYWGYQPVVNNTVYKPTYQFYSTSPYNPSISESKADSYVLRNGKPRKVGDWPDDDEDDEIGVVHPDREDLMPIGDTPWILMLLLIAGYIFTRWYKTKKIAR